MHQLHFTLRDDTGALYWNVFESPDERCLNYHADYLAHKSVPMGPDESSDWWYGNARLGITLLVIMVWANDLRPTYYIYCSHCKNQSAAFTVACLMDLQGRLRLGDYTKHRIFADVGNHSRAYYTLGLWGNPVFHKPVVDESVQGPFVAGPL